MRFTTEAQRTQRCTEKATNCLLFLCESLCPLCLCGELLLDQPPISQVLLQHPPVFVHVHIPFAADQHQSAVVFEVAVPGDDFVVAYAARKGGGRCRASMKMSPFLLDRNVPLLRPEDPIPSCDDCAACSGTRQDYPAARATTAHGLDLDGTRCKPGTHFPHKREWEPLESPTGAISTEVRRGHSNEARHTGQPSLDFSPSLRLDFTQRSGAFDHHELDPYQAPFEASWISTHLAISGEHGSNHPDQ